MSVILESPLPVQVPESEVTIEVKPERHSNLLERATLTHDRLDKLRLKNIDWVNLLGIGSLHILALGAFFLPWSWPAFNVADSCIVVGVCTLGYLMFKKKPTPGDENKNKAQKFGLRDSSTKST